MILDRPAPLTEPVHLQTVEWEETTCLLCGRDAAELLTEGADPIPAEGPGLRFAVARCRHCGLSYTNPRPTPAGIARFYPTGYGPHTTREKHRNRLPSRFWSRVFGRPCPERRGVLPWPEPGRLLDFGCGGGSYLRRMARRGWQVTGLDVAADVVNRLRDEPNLAAVAGTLPHPEFVPCSFDVVTMWQALEHVHRPLSVLHAAYELLVPGGKLVVAVPNFDSLPAGWFGEHWFGLDLPRHLTHFTPATLGAMLQTAGFRVVSVRGLVHADWLRSSATRAARAGVGGLAAQLLCWKPAARLAAWACYVLGRAECLVARHQTVARPVGIDLGTTFSLAPPTSRTAWEPGRGRPRRAMRRRPRAQRASASTTTARSSSAPRPGTARSPTPSTPSSASSGSWAAPSPTWRRN
jgi:2-polyprenyl-3-methyl-5-hydroxy-6-metoxy-1,4-benzoquinol methylase